MNNNRKLNHTTYDCKYHIVWIPKYRKKAIYGQLKKYLGKVFRGIRGTPYLFIVDYQLQLSYEKLW